MTPAQLTSFAHSQMPFSEVLGLEIVSADHDRVEATGAHRPDRCTAGGVIHGGYLMAMADSVGALAAYLNIDESATTSTIESKTNFLRPVSSGVIRFVATPIHVGRTVIVVQTDAHSEAEKLVSRTTQTQAVIQP